MNQLYAAHHAWALRVATNVVGDHHDAEDVVSEVFLAMHRAMLSGGGPKDNARAYLRRAIQNEATRIWARRKFEQVTDIVPETETPDLAEASLRALQRARALRDCPKSYPHVLFQMDVLGNTAEEAAAHLGMTVSAVKSVLHRARVHLRLAA